MKSENKSFDVGIYSFKRQVAGFICPDDDRLCKDGQLFGVLHPMTKVDYKGLYCFGVDKISLDTKTLVRKNLKFVKVISLRFERTMLMTHHEEVHQKLNCVVDYLRADGEQLTLPQEESQQSPASPKIPTLTVSAVSPSQ